MSKSTIAIKKILEEGEGDKIEFKEIFGSDIGKTICAFANASGGRIFLGVSDFGEIRGIKVNNKLKGDIQSLCDNCDPPIYFSIA